MYWGDGPIGLIQSAVGGTRVEAWSPKASAVADCPSSAAEPPYPGFQTFAGLYNAMIHPLTKYGLSHR